MADHSRLLSRDVKTSLVFQKLLPLPHKSQLLLTLKYNINTFLLLIAQLFLFDYESYQICHILVMKDFQCNFKKNQDYSFVLMSIVQKICRTSMQHANWLLQIKVYKIWIVDKFFASFFYFKRDLKTSFCNW